MGIEIADIISKEVAFQPNSWSPIERDISIEEVIKDIKHGKYAFEIKKLREFIKLQEIEKYDIYKKKLPGVTFCATFYTSRKKEQIKNYNNLLIIDIDKLSLEKIKTTKEQLYEDDFVFAFWLSPSEKGLKGLIYLDYNYQINKYGIDSSHKNAFNQITRYFKETYSIDLDISGSDTTRLCFFSYDPNLVFKTKIIPFQVKEDSNSNKITKQPDDLNNGREPLRIRHVSSKDVLLNPKGKNDSKNKKLIVKIIKYLRSNNTSITNKYENWYRVAYSIASSFTHDIGERYYLNLCELDGIKHDEIQSKNMLLYCYQNNKKKISFNTILFLAQNKGFKI
jgi:hypothetical protein